MPAAMQNFTMNGIHYIKKSVKATKPTYFTGSHSIKMKILSVYILKSTLTRSINVCYSSGFKYLGSEPLMS
jgi:hypothetical protein